MGKTFIQEVWDFLGIPFRLALFDQEWLPIFGWTTLEEERTNAVLPHVCGRLLDIGAGKNSFVKRYGEGVGVDVYDWGGAAVIVEDTSDLPFPDQSYDTVTFIASLNHIPYREAVLREAWRLLKPGGKLIITMINPVLGGIGHRLWWYSEDKKRGMKPGEAGGLWSGDIIRMCQQAGFHLERHTTFIYRMNNLYVFRKTIPEAP